MRIEDILTLNARRFPERTLVAMGEQRLTYREVDQRSSRLANAFTGLGLRHGDRVAVLLPNSPQIVEAMFATAKAGLVLVPINPRLTAGEIAFILQDSEARALLAGPEQLPLVAEADPGSAQRRMATIGVAAGERARGYWDYDDLLRAASPAWRPAVRSEWEPWVLGYTSGTTGRPKGAILTHRAKYLCSLVEALEFGTAEADCALINSPMFHVHALVHILSLASAGGSLRVTTRFDPHETLQLVATAGITELSMVPTMYQALLDCPERRALDLSAVRIARCTGAALGRALKAQILEELPGWRLHVFYGATEAGPVTRLHPSQVLQKDGSVGQPFLGVQIAIRDAAGEELPPATPGEVFIKSPYQFSGYQGLAVPFEGQDYERWITLGDLGLLDEQGFLFLQGRNKDVIKSGGENVAAQEVEEALAAHPAVRAAAVVGEPDPYWGEIVIAFVELQPLAMATPEQLAEFCRERLAPHKRPKRIEIVGALPRNALGMVDMKALKSGWGA
jgi:acyl-CoA synthetase (AMP-forming)/AMP-acid ligase II